MKAIFTGTLSGGFSLETIVHDDQAEDYVTGQLVTGTLCDALDVNDPANGVGGFSAVPNGTAYVVFGRGLSSGFEVFGPFEAHSEELEDFAEQNRGEDGEWEEFILAVDAD